MHVPYAHEESPIGGLTCPRDPKSQKHLPYVVHIHYFAATT
jgi:hypothetical protein